MKNRFVIFLVLAAVGSGYFWGAPFDRPLGSDAGMFDLTARVILDKGLFYEGDIMSHMGERIFYPVFLAGVYAVFGHNVEIARYFNILFFVLLVLLVYFLCQRVFGEQVARWAGMITALCYSIASFSGDLYREVFFPFLVFLLIYCLYRAQASSRAIWFIVSGATLAIACLTNAIVQFFIFFIVANFIFLSWNKGIKKILPKLGLFALSFSAVILPWIINSYVHFDRFAFASKEGMLLSDRAEKMRNLKDNFWAHFIANTTGDFIAKKLYVDYDPDDVRLGWESRAEWDRLVYEQGVSREEADKMFTQRALKEFARHPILFIEMSLIDFLKFNTPMVPNVRMQHMFAEPGSFPGLSSGAKIAIILAIRLLYLAFAVLIVYGLIKHFRDWQRIGWIVLIVLYFNLIFSNLHAIARYSVPIYPFYIILLVLGASLAWKKL